MKVVQINSVCGVGSTGKIAVDISKKLNDEGIENYILYGVGDSKYENGIKFGGNLNVKTHQIGTRLLGKHGFYSKKATEELIEKLKNINPDIVHLHNIHGHYLNVELLFEYLSGNKKKVIWTLHDCWSYTGHCAYYDYVDCDKWQTQCHNCPALREYPRSLIFDRSKESFEDKKRIFNSVVDLILITPSKWLAEETKKSFLSEYPVQVINNGIDLSNFKPSMGEFRKNNNLEGKFMILGVAGVWERRKGLDYFIELAKKTKDDEVIVLVGLSKDQQNKLPNNIIGVSRTSSVKELAEIYTTADVFVNPTLEDNFPTTNLEALACGTPVITFDTGGSPEAVDDQTGIVVEKGDLEGLIKAVQYIKVKWKEKNTGLYLERAKRNFDKNDKFGEYVELYKYVNLRSKVN